MTADVEAALKAVRLTFTPPAGAATAHLHRVGPSGVAADVRDWTNHVVLPGAVTVARDYEAPIGVPVAYTVDFKDGGGAVTATETVSITVPSGGCADTWLNDLARAQNTLRVVIEQLPELNYPMPTTVHDVMNRRGPIVTTDIAKTPEFELSFLTVSDDQRARARSMLGNGVPVLLRSPPEVGIGNVYMAVLAFSEQRVVSAGTVPDRRFVVNGRQIDRPHPRLYAPAPPTIYTEVKEDFATLGDLKDGRATFDAVLYNWEGEGPSDVVPWPPADV